MLKGWNVAQIETEKRRYAILAHLRATPGYELSDELLTMGARAQGIPTTADQTRAAITWLCEQGLATCREGMGMLIAALTPDGAEVADGHRMQPGVLRPGPNAR